MSEQIIPKSNEKVCGACNTTYVPKDGHSCRPVSPINIPDQLDSELLAKLREVARSLDQVIAMEVRRRKEEAQQDMFR